MINPKLIRETPEVIEASLNQRGSDADAFQALIKLDELWRTQQIKLETYQAKRNQLIPKGKPTEEQRKSLSELSDHIKQLQQDVNLTKEQLDVASMDIPNVLQSDVPTGKDETSNVVIRTEGQPKLFGFTPKPHDQLATDLNLVDFERSSKITGSRFATFTGLGARLERAISALMLDTHTKTFNYREVSPPVIINTDSLKGTGQLPKFADDQYALGDDQWLSPTAEVQLTNFHRDEILSEQDLPIKYCAFTQCFRKEAGSYGKDMRGLIRLHQFNKVELVQFVSPETSNDYLNELLSHAEQILKLLELPYRVVKLCSGDIGFSSSKTFDLEVWFPAQNCYREISSCSNFLDFQARRSKIRYRDTNQSVDYLHTLNGSGLAVGRTFAAILENYQTESGIIQLPKQLQRYMGIQEIGYEK